MSTLIRGPRNLAKALWLAITLAIIIVDYWFTIALPGKAGSIPARARWLRRQGARLLRAVGVEASYCGEPPTEGVLVSNHLGYVDILALSARHPLIFVSKADVASWPVFGLLTKFAGTLFIRREVRADVARIGQEMPKVIESGSVLAFFPEGTSTGGDRVLPFFPSLFAPAVEHGWPVTPAHIRYEMDPEEGSPDRDVAYWGDMVFGPHLLKLLGKRRIRAVVTYGKPLLPDPDGDRKAFTARVRAEVCRLGGLPVETGGVALAPVSAT